MWKFFLLAGFIAVTDLSYADSFSDKLKSIRQQLKENNENIIKNQDDIDAVSRGESQSSISKEPKDGMSKGMWKDSKTGLIWNTCQLGAKWEDDNNSCYRLYARQFLWADAILNVKGLDLYGYQDWRIPTIKELNTIFSGYDECNKAKVEIPIQNRDSRTKECVRTVKDSDKFHGHYGKIWTSSQADDLKDGVVFLDLDSYITGLVSVPRREENVRIHPMNRTHRYAVYLVRGGVSDGTFESSVKLAESDIEYEKNQKSKLEEMANKKQEQKNDENRKKQEIHKSKLESFRKNIQVGTYTKQGLIIDIKDTLVKVQQYGKQCVDYSSHLNPYNKSYDCLKTQKVVTGEVWMRKDEIFPVE